MSLNIINISVILSAYNSEQYLPFAINSILKQSYKDFELILIDDGSNDHTLELMQMFALKDERIVLIINDKNKGLPYSLNKGIEHARGKYIARQDADDISYPKRLEKQYRYMEQHTQIDLLGCNCDIIDINNEWVCCHNYYSKEKDYWNKLQSRQAIFPHGTAFCKKEVIKKLGGYDERFYYSQDGELWLRFLKNDYKLYISSDILYAYRLTPVSNLNKDKAQIIYNEIKKLIYGDNLNNEILIMEKLLVARELIKNNKKDMMPYVMANYWRGLASATILYYSKFSNTYKYLYKSYKEKDTLLNNFKKLVYFILPFFPKHLIKSILKISNKYR